MVMFHSYVTVYQRVYTYIYMSVVIPEHVEYDNVKHYPLENPYDTCFRIYIYIYYILFMCHEFYIRAHMLIFFMHLYFNTHTYIILIVTGMGKYKK